MDEFLYWVAFKFLQKKIMEYMSVFESLMVATSVWNIHKQNFCKVIILWELWEGNTILKKSLDCFGITIFLSNVKRIRRPFQNFVASLEYLNFEGLNALHYALKRGSREMVEDIIDALSEPMRLSFICRTGNKIFLKMFTTCVSIIPFFIFGFWSLLAMKIRKYKNIM